MVTNRLCKWTSDDPQGAVGMTSELTEESFGIGFERVQTGAMVIVRDSPPQDAKQVVQGLELRGVRGQVHQLQPAAMALQQRGNLVAPHGGALPPVGGGKQKAFLVGAWGGDLPLAPPSRPTAGQGGQQRQLGLILDVQIGPRRGAYLERLGA